jgi:hypothetical protein
MLLCPAVVDICSDHGVLRCWRLFCGGIHALFRVHAANNFSAVVNIASAPNFTTAIGIPSDVGVPAVTDCCSFFF